MIAHWGLIPTWAEEPRMKYATFNARAETFDTKKTFRNAWKNGQRCLVVTDGFYEWRKSDKQPFAIQRANGKLTVMAGLWEVWRSPKGESLKSCTIITTNANKQIDPIHKRMPVILAEKDWPAWLGEKKASEWDLKELLKPYSGDDLTIWPVDKRVGNVRNNDPHVADPLQ